MTENQPTRHDSGPAPQEIQSNLIQDPPRAESLAVSTTDRLFRSAPRPSAHQQCRNIPRRSDGTVYTDPSADAHAETRVPDTITVASGYEAIRFQSRPEQLQRSARAVGSNCHPNDPRRYTSLFQRCRSRHRSSEQTGPYLQPLECGFALTRTRQKFVGLVVLDSAMRRPVRGEYLAFPVLIESPLVSIR
ncbi:MAG: Uncharacterised protein [Gammaproteobacteria bacterium]|nr:MAG: Uncharacterised protein [Gammaproteobacteria bacterium]